MHGSAAAVLSAAAILPITMASNTQCNRRQLLPAQLGKPSLAGQGRRSSRFRRSRDLENAPCQWSAHLNTLKKMGIPPKTMLLPRAGQTRDELAAPVGVAVVFSNAGPVLVPTILAG